MATFTMAVRTFIMARPICAYEIPSVPSARGSAALNDVAACVVVCADEDVVLNVRADRRVRAARADFKRVHKTYVLMAHWLYF